VVAEKYVPVGWKVIDTILELVGRSRNLWIQLKDVDSQVLRIEVVACQVEGKAAKSYQNWKHERYFPVLLVDKKVFLETVSE
jgi:hypothetical protein